MCLSFQSYQLFYFMFLSPECCEIVLKKAIRIRILRVESFRITKQDHIWMVLEIFNRNEKMNKKTFITLDCY